MPDWFRRSLAAGGGLHTAGVLGRHGVESVCREARCPNRGECFAAGTATFLILGTACTRACRFCAIGHAEHPAPPGPGEPERVAAAAKEMG
ncbi:MAG: lipoyl synthase, partial [Kiritimatiellae bacterium]|nr:lipoyl synthase [Kiritimatiellia bacterium]